jgi:hypothetical protein
MRPVSTAEGYDPRERLRHVRGTFVPVADPPESIGEGFAIREDLAGQFRQRAFSLKLSLGLVLYLTRETSYDKNAPGGRSRANCVRTDYPAPPVQDFFATT